jgi:hypothetical protein
MSFKMSEGYTNTKVKANVEKTKQAVKDLISGISKRDRERIARELEAEEDDEEEVPERTTAKLGAMEDELYFNRVISNNTQVPITWSNNTFDFGTATPSDFKMLRFNMTPAWATPPVTIPADSVQDVDFEE